MSIRNSHITVIDKTNNNIKTLRGLNVRDIKSIPLKIKFDITTLDMIIRFIYKESVLKTRKTLSNIYKVMNNLDMKMYEDDPTLEARIWIIKKTLYGLLQEGMTSPEVLRTYCTSDVEADKYICDLVMSYVDQTISHNESKFLIKKIDDILEFGYVVAIKDIIRLILDRIDDGEFKSYQSVSEDLFDIATAIINVRRTSKSLGAEQTFSLEEDVFDIVIEQAVQKLKDRNRIFLTGIKAWNTILSPGYMSKRLYTYLACPGKGKSLILLKSALDIRNYNKDVKTKDPDKRPAILFITAENSVEETIERIYNMTTDSDDIRNYTPKQIKKKLREKGGLRLTSENNIDIIIKEYKNREIDTNDLYGIINDLADSGIEVISLIIDYLKRIKPFEKASDEKGELKNITNELKDLAKFFDIPVITAQQINRSGASVIDAALHANKQDVLRLVGRDSIAGAWEIKMNSKVSPFGDECKNNHINCGENQNLCEYLAA